MRSEQRGPFEKSNSENWSGENWHTERNYSRSLVGQQCDGIGDKFRIYKKTGIQVKEVGQAHVCKKCEWFAQ